MNALSFVIALVVGYLLGAINFAMIVARSKGVDILAVGSGNPGATNITRALGSKWGKIVFALDALKGCAAAGWPLLLIKAPGYELSIVSLLGAIIGHSFSIFLNFRGGKGVATSMGGLLVLMPIVLLIGIVVWVGIYSVANTVALASIAFVLSLCLSAFFLYDGGDPRFIFCLVLTALVILRHKSNIIRMFRGTESKFK